MDYPFIIWTFRRSGGTNLASALIKASQYRGIEHEPFNEDRALGYITTRFKSGVSEKEIREQIRVVLRDKKNIKHCLEIIPEELNRIIAEVSSELGYKHLFLYREKAAPRLLSLNYAKTTGIWGPKQKEAFNGEIDYSKPVDVKGLIAHEKHGRAEMSKLYKLVQAESTNTVPKISYEQLYFGDKKVTRNVIDHIYSTMGMRDRIPDDEEVLRITSNGQQNSNSEYLLFPRASELKEVADSLGKFRLGFAVALSKKK